MFCAARSEDDGQPFLTMTRATHVETKVVVEDMLNMETIHFHPGVLTKADRTRNRYLDYMRRYPRAHPSGEFIM